ncbi:MAG: hypothetical protein AAFX93_09830 [Verrucomicrobiota bacterium]
MPSPVDLTEKLAGRKVPQPEISSSAAAKPRERKLRPDLFAGLVYLIFIVILAAQFALAIYFG